jgi:hypothetical protein
MNAIEALDTIDNYINNRSPLPYSGHPCYQADKALDYLRVILTPSEDARKVAALCEGQFENEQAIIIESYATHKSAALQKRVEELKVIKNDDGYWLQITGEASAMIRLESKSEIVMAAIVDAALKAKE